MSRSTIGSRTPLDIIVGPVAQPLERARGIRTVGDLLDWLPRTYLDPARPVSFAEVPDGEDVVVVGTVTAATTHQMRARKGRRLVVDVRNDAGQVAQLTFFKPFGHQQRLLPGTRVLCSGQIGSFKGVPQLTHPDYEVLGEDSTHWMLRGLLPVYPATPGVRTISHGHAIELVLHQLDGLPDPIPGPVRQDRRLPDLLEAYRLVHRPATAADHRRGRHRLRFQEAFVVQAALARARHASDAVPARPRVARPGGLVDALMERLPYRLTDGQQQVNAEITQDLAGTVPMHRLLQGEVGSGKTVLALLAMLTTVDGGGQAALLAPTEVLAAQHHRSLLHLLGPIAEGGMLGGREDGTRVALLTGSQGTADRRAALLAAAGGQAGIVVGTHALIQEHVQFAELGLVVVDEQHRFGVEQRDALRAKAGEVAPHLLVMTATPIPRTVAMTVFGDMSTSTLRELPQGRQPIASHVVTADLHPWVRRTWQRVAEEVAGGGQVYVVCPRIGEEDDPPLEQAEEYGPGLPMAPVPDAGGEPTRPGVHGVHQVLAALRRLDVTAGLRSELLHGRMPAEDKDRVMRRFADGEVDVLVSTTVIEVGVDVPDATTMVVMDADRFGISQLHQLRGRVGRGGRPGLCLLMTQGARDDPGAVERLHQVAATTDGFELARLDLENRREGDVLGANQSGGRSGLRFLRLTRDEDLIVDAHDAAWATVAQDPDLTGHRALAEAIDRMDEAKTQFLERG